MEVNALRQRALQAREEQAQKKPRGEADASPRKRPAADAAPGEEARPHNRQRLEEATGDGKDREPRRAAKSTLFNRTMEGLSTRASRCLLRAL